MRRPCCVLAGLIITAATPVMLGAQGVAMGAAREQYSFRSPGNAALSRVEMSWAPFGVWIALGPMLASRITGGLARSSMTAPGESEIVLEGVAATRLELDLGLAGGAVTMGAWGLIPGTYDTESVAGARMMGVLATELLPFSPEPWGARPGVGARVSGAADLGGLELKVEGGYAVRGGGGIPGGQDLRYEPGAELHASVLADVVIGRTGVLSLQLGLQRFGSDMVDGQNLFRSGTRVEGLVALAFPVGLMGSARLYTGLRHRSAGIDGPAVEWLPGVTNAPLRQLALSGFDARIPFGRWAVLADTGIRVLRSRGGPCLLSRSADVAYERTCPSGQGWLASAGLSLELRLAEWGGRSRLTLMPFGRFHAGEVMDWALRGSEDGGAGQGRRTSGVHGWQAGLGVRAAR